MQNVECKIRRFMLWIALVGFVADRLIKWYAQHLPNGTVFSFGPGLNFGHYPNPALFFFPPWRFIPWLALIVLVGLGIGVLVQIKLFHQTKSPAISYLLLAICPILLGGVSNVFDRFFFKGVIDYVNILGLATLNLADIMILLGLVILTIGPTLSRHPSEV